MEKDFLEKLRVGYYFTKLNHPRRTTVKEKTEEDDQRYKDQLNAYKADADRLFAEFKKDLFEVLEITNNPKAEEVYNLAQRYAYYDGLDSVYAYAKDLAKLIK
jgi:hypothetical protein